MVVVVVVVLHTAWRYNPPLTLVCVPVVAALDPIRPPCMQYVELQKARDELEAKLLQDKHAVEKRREPMVWEPPSPK